MREHGIKAFKGTVVITKMRCLACKALLDEDGDRGEGHNEGCRQIERELEHNELPTDYVEEQTMEDAE